LLLQAVREGNVIRPVERTSSAFVPNPSSSIIVTSRDLRLVRNREVGPQAEPQSVSSGLRRNPRLGPAALVHSHRREPPTRATDEGHRAGGGTLTLSGSTGLTEPLHCKCSCILAPRTPRCCCRPEAPRLGPHSRRASTLPGCPTGCDRVSSCRRPWTHGSSSSTPRASPPKEVHHVDHAYPAHAQPRPQQPRQLVGRRRGERWRGASRLSLGRLRRTRVSHKYPHLVHRNVFRSKLGCQANTPTG